MDRAQEIGVFRWRVICEAVDPSLSPRERGMLVRSLAAREHLGPDGRWVRVSRNTVDRWIRAYREGGFDALVPAPRRMTNQTPERLLELAWRCGVSSRPGRRRRSTGSSWRRRAARLRRARSTVTWRRRGCRGRAGRSGGRWGASRPSSATSCGPGTRLHGPLIDGHRAFLFCFLDDHSRLFCGYRWAAREDVLNASRALRAGIAARGVPTACYVDNGSPFVSGQLLRACAVLGIRLIHSRPGRPEGRGKIERVFRTIREQVLGELEDHPPASPQELNQTFQAWVEPVYHRRVHSETGQAPLERFLAPGAPQLPGERSLREAFRWAERRTVSQTGHGRDARQHLRGRPRARRPAGGADLRPVGADRGRGPRRRTPRRAGDTAQDQTARSPPRPAAGRASAADRDRLPRPGPQAPRAGASEADRLPQPARPAPAGDDDNDDHDNKEQAG